MKKLLLKISAAFSIAISFVVSFAGISQKPVYKPSGKSSVHEFEMRTLTGENISLSKFKGKKMLIVNVASKCGFTPQYKNLQALHEKYGNKVAILGFPANNFGGQEPGSAGEIQEFCSRNYGVSFQMMEKISVKGKDMHPLYLPMLLKR